MERDAHRRECVSSEAEAGEGTSGRTHAGCCMARVSRRALAFFSRRAASSWWCAALRRSAAASNRSIAACHGVALCGTHGARRESCEREEQDAGRGARGDRRRATGAGCRPCDAGRRVTGAGAGSQGARATGRTAWGAMKCVREVQNARHKATPAGGTEQRGAASPPGWEWQRHPSTGSRGCPGPSRGGLLPRPPGGPRLRWTRQGQGRRRGPPGGRGAR